MQHLVSVVGQLQYDVCVLTGDYRGKTYGPFEKSMKGVGELRDLLRGPVYGVLGNHDSIRMAPAMETMGIRLLFNECDPIVCGDDRIYLAGVDDPHFYRAISRRRLHGYPRELFQSCCRILQKSTLLQRPLASLLC